MSMISAQPVPLHLQRTVYRPLGFRNFLRRKMNRASHSKYPSRRCGRGKNAFPALQKQLSSIKTLLFLPAPRRAITSAPGLRIRPHAASQGRGLRFRAGGSGPAHGHAEMLRLDKHRHAQRLHILIEEIGNLSCQTLLYLGTPGKTVHNPGKFGKPDNSPVFWIGNMRPADKGQQMVLTPNRGGISLTSTSSSCFPPL